VTPLTDDELANRRKLLKDVSFGIANAITAGGLKKMVDRKSTGFASDLGANLWIGVTSFTNMLSLGFQDAILEGISETKGELTELTDLHFEVFDETAGPGALIGYGLAATVVGTIRGTKNNVVNLLPVAEIETLTSSHASTASTWEAVFTGISKLASLVAMGAGARQNAARRTPVESGQVVEINVASKPSGGMFDKHASAYFRRFRLLYERDGRGTTHTVTDRPESWNDTEIYPDKGTDIYLTDNEMRSIFDFVKKNTNRKGWRKKGFTKSIVWDNCSMEIGRMLKSIGIDTISLSPTLLEFSVQHQNIFTAVKSFAPNSMIQRTERKK
jgi:hypothetical protein